MPPRKSPAPLSHAEEASAKETAAKESSATRPPVAGPERYIDLLLAKTPLIDVRAPVEYARGHLPGAVNLPLLNDEERSAVGTCYKQRGRDAAVALGHELVAGDSKQARVSNWLRFARKHPGAMIYCFRGGQRSRISQSWIAEAGVTIPRIAGGYKAVRRQLIEAIETTASQQSMLILGGKTGSAKTHLLNALENSVDLEGLARHRGSAFGKRIQPQPSQSDFENRLAVALLHHQKSHGPESFLILEDEGRAIGSVHIPQSIHDAMRNAPLALIEAPLAQRVQTIWQDYIRSNFLEFKEADPTGAGALLSDFLLGSLDRIQKRLGGERHQRLRGLMASALHDQLLHGDDSGHLAWIESLLVEYYDPMYEYQLEKKAHRIVFRGSGDEFLSWQKTLVGKAQDMGTP